MKTLTRKHHKKPNPFHKTTYKPFYEVGFKQVPELTIDPFGVEEIAHVFKDKLVKMEMGFEGKAWKMKFEQVGSEVSVCVLWIGVEMGAEKFKLILYAYINKQVFCMYSYLNKLPYVGMSESI